MRVHTHIHTKDTQRCLLSKAAPIFISQLKHCVQMNQSKLLTRNLVTRRAKYTRSLITCCQCSEWPYCTMCMSIIKAIFLHVCLCIVYLCPSLVFPKPTHGAQYFKLHHVSSRRTGNKKPYFTTHTKSPFSQHSRELQCSLSKQG